MKTLTQFLFILLALPFASTTLAATSPVGATPGSFAVSPSGAATYSIPIQVPPGVGGMQPSLSLSYNSQGGNGIAGVGWGIGGLSAITRCGATIDRDGYKGGVNLDWNDKYCLDGQRLILVSGTYGYAFSEYRTEIESFNKVVATAPRTGSTAGLGPWSFTVTSKNGVTTEYGNGNGSQQFAQNNGTVLSWHVSNIKDAMGNYVQFVYNTDSATSGEHRIDHIDYTYNGTAFVGGVARSVKFNYGPRGVNPDVETSYVGGGAVKTSQRLTSVQTSVGASSVRSYNLGYDNSAATGRSRLASVQECGADGVCLLPVLVAGWQDVFDIGRFSTASLFNLANQYLEHSNRTVGFQIGDFNGDGRSDIIRWGDTTGSYNAVFLSNGDGSFTQATAFNLTNQYLQHSNGTVGFQIGDFNGDGKTDILRWWDTVSGNAVFLSNGNGSFTQATAFNLDNQYLQHSNKTVGMQLV